MVVEGSEDKTMLNQYFVNQGIREAELEDFIKSSFPAGDYSEITLQRTPLGLKIVILTNKPGRIIGRKGKNIEKIGDSLKEKFKLDNPQIDIKAIKNPDLDPKIVSKQIASALERGYNYKKIGNVFLKRIMDAGAIGTEIVITGTLGGNMARKAKYNQGYLKKCGDTGANLVHKGFYEAQVPRGTIGVTVKIMREFRDITGATKTKAELEAEKIEGVIEGEEKGEEIEQILETEGEKKPKTRQRVNTSKKGKAQPNRKQKSPKKVDQKAKPAEKTSPPAVAKESKPVETEGAKAENKQTELVEEPKQEGE